MTPEEAAVISTYSKSVLFAVIILFVNTGLYSFALVLMYSCTKIQLKRNLRTRGTLMTFFMIVTLFIVATLEWGTQVLENVILIKVGLINIVENNVEEHLRKAGAQLTWIIRFQIWPENINFFVTDAMVVSRVWALFPENRLAKGSCLFLLLSSLAVSLASCITFNLQLNEFSPLVQIVLRTPPLVIASWSISLLTNIVTTGWIAALAWQHRQAYTQAFRASSVQRILCILVETGAAFIVVQLIVVCISTMTTPIYSAQDLAKRLVIHTTIVVSAMYPCLLVIVIDKECTEQVNGEVSTMEMASTDREMTIPTSFIDLRTNTREAREKNEYELSGWPARDRS